MNGEFIWSFLADRASRWIDDSKRTSGGTQPSSAQVTQTQELITQIMPDWLSDADEALVAKDVSEVILGFGDPEQIRQAEKALEAFINWIKNKEGYAAKYASFRGYMRNLADPDDRQTTWLLIIKTITDPAITDDNEKFKLAIAMMDSFSLHSDRWKVILADFKAQWTLWKPKIVAHTATMRTDAWRQAKADVVINSVSGPAAAILAKGLDDLFGDPNRESQLTILFRRGVNWVRAKIHI